MIPDVDFKKYYKDMGQRESGRIHKPSRWIDQIAERISRGGKPWGDCLPWTKCDELIRLRPGELSIWGGMSGHKKSMLLGWVMCNLAKNYESPVALASLEMPPEETIFRMARQCTGCDPSVDAVGDFLKWSDERFVIYDELDTVHFQRILGFVYYCAVELGYRHIVIDSLTKCGISPKDSGKEKMFLDKLQWCAKTTGCHIHLVAHIRKPQNAGEEYIPTKFDIRGAGEITDLADNVFICWSNKKRAEILTKQEKFGNLDASDAEYLTKSVDQKLIAAKQRNGTFEGTVNLFFERRSMQFVATEGRRHDFKYKTTYEAAA